MKKLTPKKILIIAASIIGSCFFLAILASLIPDPPPPEPTIENRSQQIDLDQTTPTYLDPTQTNLPTDTLIPSLTATKSTSTKCHKSYPTVCIPPPPPDLDCKDISYRRFKVIPPDPHHFDTDGDGIGCET